MVQILTKFGSPMQNDTPIILILTLNGSNDVFPTKEGPFGGHDNG